MAEDEDSMIAQEIQKDFYAGNPSSAVGGPSRQPAASHSRPKPNIPPVDDFPVHE